MGELGAYLDLDGPQPAKEETLQSKCDHQSHKQAEVGEDLTRGRSKGRYRQLVRDTSVEVMTTELSSTDEIVLVCRRHHLARISVE